MPQLKVFLTKTPFKDLGKFYCTKNAATLLQTSKTLKQEQQLENSADLATGNSDECAKFEQRMAKQVLIEKEQDANLQSRLSKDCKVFLARCNSATALRCGSIRVEQLAPPTGSPDWLSDNFTKFQLEESGKCPPVPTNCPEPAKPKEPQCAPAGGTDGGSKESTVAPPRLVRQEPGKVLFAFVPEEWWRAFIPKTGVTGFGVFLFTFSTFLVSKEYYVLEHEFYGGLSMLLLWFIGIKYYGAQVGQTLDKHIDAIEKEWEDVRSTKYDKNTVKEAEKKQLEENILNELHWQYQMAGQELLLAAKRENVLLQLEEEYRKRQMQVYEEVKNRLDYQVAINGVRQKVQHRNLIEYVTREVLKSITPEMQSKLVDYSIDQILKNLENMEKPQ
ncbi:hypothetical protein HUJ04_004308 [Dendroctonus ponderosae]|nr:hypothetical protein HUJ04_004308 [Dendroctonus ponderosae]KAH1014531.1 hypothetical protein HUJ05_012386 [Dendroctonus ponderosae]